MDIAAKSCVVLPKTIYTFFGKKKLYILTCIHWKPWLVTGYSPFMLCIYMCVCVCVFVRERDGPCSRAYGPNLNMLVSHLSGQRQEHKYSQEKAFLQKPFCLYMYIYSGNSIQLVGWSHAFDCWELPLARLIFFSLACNLEVLLVSSFDLQCYHHMYCSIIFLARAFNSFVTWKTCYFLQPWMSSHSNGTSSHSINGLALRVFLLNPIHRSILDETCAS